MERSPADAALIEAIVARSRAPVFERAFGQPEDQRLPGDLLAMLAELDRTKR